MQCGDSMSNIYDTLKQCATIAAHAGGVGLCLSSVRSNGSFIAGSNGHSNGIVPLLQVFNTSTRYVDQGGKVGQVCACALSPATDRTNQNSLFRSDDWLSANQGPVFTFFMVIPVSPSRAMIMMSTPPAIFIRPIPIIGCSFVLTRQHCVGVTNSWNRGYRCQYNVEIATYLKKLGPNNCFDHKDLFSVKIQLKFKTNPTVITILTLFGTVQSAQ